MLTRRTFLEASIATWLTASGWSADEAPAKLAFGFSLYGMKSIPVLDAIDLCGTIGYDAIEIAALPDWPTFAARLSAKARREIAQRLVDRRISLAAVMENLPVPADDAAQRGLIDRLKQACQLGADLGDEKRPVIETILGGKPGSWDEVKRQFVDRTGQWAKIAAEAGMILAVKPHRLHAMNRPEQALWLLDQVQSSSLKLVYDFSHFQHRELTIRETLAQLLPHTAFVHIKDTVVENGKERFVLPGDGGVDYRELFEGLIRAKWSDCVCVEVSGMVSSKADYDPQAAARRSYENLLPALRNGKLRD